MNLSMGLDSSKLNEEIIPLPTTSYKPLHQDLQWIPAPVTVIQELRHSTFREGDQPLNVTACAFPPNDDSVLITLTTFSSMQPPLRAGFVQNWELHDEADTRKGDSNNSLFTYAPRPALSFSPDGEIISVILNSGKGQLILVERCKDETLEPCKVDCKVGKGGPMGSDTSLCSRALCCVFSSNGTKVVTITNATLHRYRPGRETHELCLWKVSSERSLQCVWRVSCEVILPTFSGYLVSCVFSPDGSLLALSTSVGQLYVLQTQTMELFAVIKTEIAIDNKCTCSFSPCYANDKLAACLQDGHFQVWKLTAGRATCVIESVITRDPVKLTTFSYSFDGCILAFGTSTGKVFVYESEFLQVLFELDPFQLPLTDSNIVSMSVHSVAFAKSCQELAVGYGDSCARIWQLPIKMDLQHMCRLAIIRIVPPCELHRLPLPKSVKAYLLYSYNTVDDHEV